MHLVVFLGVPARIPAQRPGAPGALVVPAQLLVADQTHGESGVIWTCCQQYTSSVIMEDNALPMTAG